MDECDPEALLEAAKCFACLNTFELDAILTWELCQWANAEE
jgi:hypothetical protein